MDRITLGSWVISVCLLTTIYLLGDSSEPELKSGSNAVGSLSENVSHVKAGDRVIDQAHESQSAASESHSSTGEFYPVNLVVRYAPPGILHDGVAASLDPIYVQLLDLSDEEVSMINSEIRKVGLKIRQLESENAKLVETSEGLYIDVPAFPLQLKKLQESFRTALSSLANEKVLVLEKGVFHVQGEAFGKMNENRQFTFEFAGDNTIKFVIERLDSEGVKVGGLSSVIRENAFDGLEMDYGHIIDIKGIRSVLFPK